jgi:AraC-like DNA-binding protein
VIRNARNADLEKMAMNEPQLLRMPLRPLAVRDLEKFADIAIGTKETTKSRAASEIYRVGPCAEVVRTFEIINARFDLLQIAKNSLLELEFLTSSHLVIFLTGCCSKGCEWSNGRQIQMSTSLAPHIVMFNPAQNYLRIRAAALRNNCHMLMLTIQPNVMSWRNDLETDLATVRFQQKIDLNDEAACQTLVAMKEELEAPGINGAFYIDTLLSLLLTRLTRCASNLAEPSKPTYTKGGLPNWRLKQAIELLKVDPAKMPTLAEVAELIGLHPTSFCRGFKQSMGLPPHRYMLVHRVNRAKKMMDDQRLSLTQIALDCGFSSSSQFSVVFKRITGTSPREFRRAL